MIYVVLLNTPSVEQTDFLKFIKEHIKYGNFYYRIINVNLHIVDSEFKHIDRENDIIIWQPIVVFNNIEFVKNYINSVVVLRRQSIFLQKISEFNPVNENMAINHGLYLIYTNPEEIDITNDDYRLAISEDYYLLNIPKLKELLSFDPTNIRENKLTPEVKPTPRVSHHISKYQVRF